MKFKVVGALLCVMVMVMCPLAIMMTDTEAAEDTKVSATVTLDNLSKDKVDNVFNNGESKNIESEITGVLFTVIGLNSTISKSSEITSDINNFNYRSGNGVTIAGNKESVKIIDFYSYDCNIEFQFKIKKSETEIPLISNVAQYEGNGVRELLKAFGKTSLKENDSVTIKGKVSYESYVETNDSDIFLNNANDEKYFPLKVEQRACEKLKFDLNITINNDKTFRDEFSLSTDLRNTWEYEILNGDKSEYKEGSLQSAKWTKYYEMADSDGTKTIDGNRYGYNHSAWEPRRECGPWIIPGPKAVDLNANVNFANLHFFDKSQKDDEKIKADVAACNGNATNDFSVFDKEAGSIRSDFRVDDGTNNLMIFYGIAAVILVAMLALFLYDRKKRRA